LIVTLLTSGLPLPGVVTVTEIVNESLELCMTNPAGEKLVFGLTAPTVTVGAAANAEGATMAESEKTTSEDRASAINRRGSGLPISGGLLVLQAAHAA